MRPECAFDEQLGWSLGEVNRDGFLDLLVANYTSPYDYPNE